MWCGCCFSIVTGPGVSLDRQVGLPAVLPRTGGFHLARKVFEAGTCHERLTTELFHVPGTIRTCQKFLINYNRRQLLMLLQNCTEEGKQH